jgi:hypothetical protein
MIVGLLTLLAFVLRVSQLSQGLVGDEVFTYQDIIGHSLRAVLTTVHTGGENSPPLFFLLSWATAHIGDPSETIRLPSMVLGSATVPVVYLLGREVHGRLAALIAAGVMAIAPFPVFYGIEARPYATMMFFVVVSTWTLLRAVRTGGRGWWVLYTLAAACAAYSHYTAIFVLGAQAVWSLWRCREHPRAALLANAAIVLLYLPWLPHLRGKALAVIGYIYPLGVHRVLTDLLRPFPGHPAAPNSAIPTTAGLLVVVACLLAGAIAIVVRRRRAPAGAPRPRATADQWLLAALVFATPVGLLLYSVLDTDLWLPRGLSASLPALALGVGALLAALPGRLMVLAVAAVTVTLAAGTLRSFEPAWSRGPFRSLSHYLDRVASPRDPIYIDSFVGAPAVAAEVRKPHLLEGSFAATWPAVPVGGTAYIGLDAVLLSRHAQLVPHRAGFVIVARHAYTGGYAIELVTYRRVSASS